MSKIVDFYKKAKDDPKIMADIEAVQKKYANAAKFDEKITADLIEVAKKHGTTLTPEDFQVKKADLGEDDLATVAGGCSESDKQVQRNIHTFNETSIFR
jgi:hypothetical protein